MTTKKHEVPEELLSGLLADYKKPEDLIGENGLLKLFYLALRNISLLHGAIVRSGGSGRRWGLFGNGTQG